MEARNEVKIAMYNASGLADKELQIDDFMIQHKIWILGISDISIKREKTKTSHKIMHYFGVE